MWNGMGQSVPGTGMDMNNMGGGIGMAGGYGGGMGGGMGMGGDMGMGGAGGCVRVG